MWFKILHSWLASEWNSTNTKSTKHFDDCMRYFPWRKLLNFLHTLHLRHCTDIVSHFRNQLFMYYFTRPQEFWGGAVRRLHMIMKVCDNLLWTPISRFIYCPIQRDEFFSGCIFFWCGFFIHKQYVNGADSYIYSVHHVVRCYCPFLVLRLMYILWRIFIGRPHGCDTYPGVIYAHLNY
jgi:hypothetical protein